MVLRSAQRLTENTEALQRLARYLIEHCGYGPELIEADASDIVDATVTMLRHSAEANRKFCEVNQRLDHVVSATYRAMREQGYVP
jgi:erythromycin esterase-like protein